MLKFVRNLLVMRITVPSGYQVVILVQVNQYNNKGLNILTNIHGDYLPGCCSLPK